MPNPDGVSRPLFSLSAICHIYIIPFSNRATQPWTTYQTEGFRG